MSNRKNRPDIQLHGTQAARLFAKFGGPLALKLALDQVSRPRSIVTVYRWNMPRPSGTGGTIPAGSLPDVLLAAGFAGLAFSAEDLDPRPR
jgi:hypothetical protein